MHNEYSPQLSKLLYNCKLKNKKAHKNTLKGSRRMGGGRIFLSNLHETYFKKDLSMSLISAGFISLNNHLDKLLI
jgi:hypothetical protein